jgi:hypothetical protein
VRTDGCSVVHRARRAGVVSSVQERDGRGEKVVCSALQKEVYVS